MRSVDLLRNSLMGCSLWHSAKTSLQSNLQFSTFARRQRLHSVQNHVNKAFRMDYLSKHQYQCSQHCLLIVPQRKMAGHSHWQNIKSTKEAADNKHMLMVQSYVSQMKAAITDNGSNPETNSKLATILERMKNANIPKNDIKRYLENATKKAGTMQTLYYEVRGPAGTIFVMEVETESAKKARDSLNTLIKKTIGKVKDVPSFQSFFDMKGIITVPVTKDMQTSNMDEYLEIAIETGAEDVIMTKDDSGLEEYEYVLKFHCDPVSYRKVAKEIEKSYNLEYSSCAVELIPHHYVTIESEDDLKACTQIANKLQSHPDFVSLFDNVSPPED